MIKTENNSQVKRFFYGTAMFLFLAGSHSPILQAEEPVLFNWLFHEPEEIPVEDISGQNHIGQLFRHDHRDPFPKQHLLHCEAVDEQAWIYINGQDVGKHTTASNGEKVSVLWQQPFSIVEAIAQIDGTEAGDILMQAARQQDGWVKTYASRSLSNPDLGSDMHQGNPPGIYIVSPYDQVDWDVWQQYIFDGHVHARRGTTVQQMVEACEKMGYAAIAFADSRLHYPLAAFIDNQERDYEIIVLPGQGNLYYSQEEPFAQHMKIWFSEVDYNIGELSFEESLAQVGRDNGRAIFAHPASNMYPMYSIHVDAQWYIQHFDRHSHLIGIEVNNHDLQGGLRLFDDLLRHYGSRRLIVGFGVSDTQGLAGHGGIGGAGGFGYSLLLSEERSHSAFRAAIEKGRLFWVDTEHPKTDTERLVHPEVEAIKVDQDQIRVHTAEHNEKIVWIYDNREIKHGPTFNMASDLADAHQNYVRFEIRDGNTTLGSQAFYLISNNLNP